ncbi:MAG: response regulator [Magnetospirillum sp. WYHS-4]
MNPAPMDRRRILVVEDSPTQAMLMQLRLEQEGFEAIVAPTAEAALESLGQVRPDLMLVDYHLPGIQGDELCRRVRMNINTQGIPILMLTAEQSAAAEVRGLESGADDYVGKAEDPDVLMLRIRALLRKSSTQVNLLMPDESFFRKARVLAIDDSPTYLELLRAELSEEGYTVETAASGLEGLGHLDAESFDCVLVDLVMPGMDGLEVIREIVSRQAVEDSPVVILMVSAQETKENAMRALESGADDFVGKSSDISVLKGRLRAMLRHKYLHEQHKRIIDEFKRQEDDLERAVEERTRELKGEIAERRRAEEELRKAKEIAEAASRAKTEFLANMSHELRTPLNAIIGFSDMIRNQVFGKFADCTVGQKYLEYIDNIHDSGVHLLKIINDILDVSRIEVGKVKLNEEYLDLREVVKATERLIRSQADKNKVRLRTELPDSLPALLGDERILKQTILNLMSNAVKFTPEGGTVTATIRLRQGGVLEVAVMDTGIGIAPEDHGKVMLPFGQVDSSLSRRHEGTGLGLPLAKTFMELHGGSLTLESALGQGTTVTLSFPQERTQMAA